MTDAVKIAVGTETLEVPLVMNLWTLKRAWLPFKALLNARDDDVNMASAAAALVAACVVETRPECTLEWIERRVTINKRTGTDQRPALISAAVQIARESGFVLIPENPESGEAEAAQDAATVPTKTST